jgi:hypothetical protein
MQIVSKPNILRVPVVTGFKGHAAAELPQSLYKSMR